jgi:hypothetical protein
MTSWQHSDSFVTRIWLERGTTGDPVWRGHVRHVQSEQQAYFQNLGEMSDFLARVSGVSGPRLTSETAEIVGFPKPGPAANEEDD